MITIKILGGLGNQLSAYSMGYSISKSRGEELVLDVSDYDNGYFRPYSLDALNIAKHRKLTYKNKYFDPLSPKSLPSAPYEKHDVILEQNPDIKNRDDVNKILGQSHNSYITGYWGFNFISGYEDEIRGMFTPVKQSSRLLKFLDLIRNQISVAVHVRLTDFVWLQWATSMDYYMAAIAYIQSIYPNAIFYFFSDDIQCVKEKLGDCESFRYVKLLGGVDADIDEFFCISACNHCILSPKSTYSTWARWLNDQDNSIDVVYSDMTKSCEETTGARNKKRITMSGHDVKKWKDVYDGIVKNTREKGNIESIENMILKHMANNENDMSLSLLDDFSFDSYYMDNGTYERFLSYYAAACMQAQNTTVAVKCYYRQKQFSSGKVDFHYNYFKALRHLKKHPESAIQAGMSAKLSNSAELTTELRESFESQPTLLNLFDTVVNTPKKHFIICPLTAWTYWVRDSQSLAVILAMMGHEVSFIAPNQSTPINANTIDGFMSTSVTSSLNLKKNMDSIYSYGITYYPSFRADISGESRSNIPGIIQRLSLDDSDIQTVVIARNPDALQSLINNGAIKYIFVDCEESDPEYSVFSNIRQQYVEYMFQGTNISIFFDPDAFYKFNKTSDMNKCLLFKNERYKIKYKYVDNKYDFSQNYIASRDSYNLAAFILKSSGK